MLWLGAGAVLSLAGAGPATAADTCAKVAAANGSDAASGTAAAPYATVERVVTTLAPGETGCVRGRVVGSSWIDTSNVTLTSEPGQRGHIVGQVVIGPATRNVTVRDLDLDASQITRPSPIVLGDDALVAGNDITNGHAPMLCMIIGALNHDSGARAERTRVERNRIHDCGTSDNHRHGIYVEHALDTRIVGNEILDNADRGIQLFPHAQGTIIEGNVIDGNGEGIIFSGRDGYASSNTTVRYNVISNAKLRAGVESWWPEGNPVGTNNVVERNCVWGGRDQIDDAGGGFVHRDNLTADPRFVNVAARDLRLQAGSPCAELLEAGRVGGSAAVAAPAPAPATLSAPTAPTAPVTAVPPLEVSLTYTPAPTPLVAIKVKRRTKSAAARPIKARVELRYRGRGWRTVGVRRVPRSKSITLRSLVPRRARGVVARVTPLRRSGRRVFSRSAVSRARL